ncbi:MAG: heme A synthase, partial [Candidatus Zixiibacteriota bacterium]
ALKSFRHKPKILYPSIAATALTAFQGWQGSVVVASQLEPIVVTVHMVLALIIVSLLIYVTQEAYFSEREPGNLSQVLPKNTTVWFSVLWVLAIAQIILGTQIRSALELLREEFPLMNSFEWLSKVGAINHIHMTLGVVLLAFTWYVGASTLKYKKQLPLLLKQSVIGMVLIASIQLILGMMFMLMEMTALMQVFHLWMASLYIGIVLLLFTISKRSQVE